jgi:hypothetical protein
MAMRLVGIEPDHLPASTDEIYTFECAECGIITVQAVGASTRALMGTSGSLH